MSEIEQMLAKPKADVEAIAVQFGVFSAEVAAGKTKEELVSALSGVPVDSLPGAKKQAPKSSKTTKEKSAPAKKAAPAKEAKPAAKKTTAKKTTKKADAPLETPVEAAPSVEETVAPEVKTEEAPKAKKAAATKAPAKKPAAKKTPAKKTTKKADAPVAEEKVEEISNETSDVVVAEAPAKKTATKKTTKRTSKKADAEVKAETPDVVVTDTPSEETPVEEAPKAETKPTKKKTTKKSKKTEEAAPEVKAEEISATEENAEAAPAEEKADASKAKKTKGKKRRISFGPDQETKQVEIPEGTEANAEAAEEVPAAPVVPEIQYIEIEGILSITGENKNDFCGFIHKTNYLPGEEDAYVPGQIIRRLGLRRGDKIKGLAVPARGKDKYSPLKRVLAVNDEEIPEDSDFEFIRKRPRFEHLTAIYPNERLTLETGSEDLSCRIIDLFSPIGKGQRGMIVSPPKAGKTILLQKVANAITANNPNCKVIVLLIDERPEEVTDMQRSIKGEVVYSTFDKRPENHVRVTELVLERAMRLVEKGEDVVILLDSMTRLARAYNLTINPTGRTLSGGLDPGSLYGPKRFFGAARNIEFGGSLTIIATALIETGSRMDEVIFEEFKGTGNMEVVLDRKLADRRVYPAIAVEKSGTRREDLLLTQEELESVWLTRKAIAEVDTIAAAEAVINFMKRTNSNSSFVLSAKKSFSVDS